MKRSRKFTKFAPSHVSACTPLQVKDVVVRADDVRPIRIPWSDRDGENSVGLGGVDKILARDPALELALLRGLQD